MLQFAYEEYVIVLLIQRGRQCFQLFNLTLGAIAGRKKMLIYLLQQLIRFEAFYVIALVKEIHRTCYRFSDHSADGLDSDENFEHPRIIDKEDAMPDGNHAESHKEAQEGTIDGVDAPET